MRINMNFREWLAESVVEERAARGRQVAELAKRRPAMTASQIAAEVGIGVNPTINWLYKVAAHEDREAVFAAGQQQNGGNIPPQKGLSPKAKEALEVATLRPALTMAEIAELVGMAERGVRTVIMRHASSEDQAAIRAAGMAAKSSKTRGRNNLATLNPEKEAARRLAIKLASEDHTLTYAEIQAGLPIDVPYDLVRKWVNAAGFHTRNDPERDAAARRSHRENTAFANGGRRVMTEEDEFELARLAFTEDLTDKDLAELFDIGRSLVGKIIARFATPQDLEHRKRVRRDRLREAFWRTVSGKEEKARVAMLWAVAGNMSNGEAKRRSAIFQRLVAAARRRNITVDSVNGGVGGPPREVLEQVGLIWDETA